MLIGFQSFVSGLSEILLQSSRHPERAFRRRNLQSRRAGGNQAALSPGHHLWGLLAGEGQHRARSRPASTSRKLDPEARHVEHRTSPDCRHGRSAPSQAGRTAAVDGPVVQLAGSSCGLVKVQRGSCRSSSCSVPLWRQRVPADSQVSSSHLSHYRVSRCVDDDS